MTLWLAGLILLAAGILLIVLSILLDLHEGSRVRSEVGFVIGIGPIPICFASSRRMLWILFVIWLAICIAMLILAVLLVAQP